jgi:hypothetical protein
MAYGTVKVDNITFDNGGSDQNVTVSGLYRATTSGVTVTGTISGAVLVGTTTVSGATVTGNVVQGTTVQGVSGTFTSLTGTTTTGTTANFASGVFTTRVSGTIITGDTGQFTSGTFVSLTGTTITGTTINAVTVSSTTGTFTSLTGTTITGTTINGVTVAATTGSFTSLTGTTTSGTTANFVSGVFTTQVSGTTVTGTTSNFTSGNFATLSGATATFTSGIIASGTAAAPSLAILADLDTGLFSPGANQVAVATNGAGRLFIDASGRVGVGLASTGSTFRSTGLTGVSIIEAFGADADGFADLEIKSNGASGASRLYFSDTAAQSGLIRYSHNTNSLEFATAGSECLRITSAGLVGIGTSAPTSTLHIQHAAQTAGYWEGKGLLIHEDATANQGIALYSRNAAEQYIASLADDADSYLIIGTRKSSSVNEVNAITIRGDGKVGIGTTSPGSALEINAAAATSPFIAKINTAEVARVDSSGRLLVGASADSGGALLQVNGDRIRVATAKTPASAADTGTAGEICWDADYIYVCTATNTWKRTAISTW